MDPNAYKFAIHKTAKIIKESGVEVDYLNVGGGFPSEYPGMKPQPLIRYFNVINSEFSKHFSKNSQIILKHHKIPTHFMRPLGHTGGGPLSLNPWIDRQCRIWMSVRGGK